MATKQRADGHPVVLTPLHRLWRLHARLQARLPMWTVYRPTTREYPGLFVSRMVLTLPDVKVTRFVITHPTLEGLREHLPPGLHRLNRAPEDVPEIIEVWL